jgi:UDP-glucose 4-epimerase
MRILVTGSSGRVGSAVARLLGSVHEVLGFDRVPGPETTVVGRVEDQAVVVRAMGGIDAVVHTASLHAPHVGLIGEREFRSVNIDGTRILLEEAARRGVRRFIYTSTTSVYGHALVPVDRAVWVTESVEPRPRDIYDETKLAAEALCQAATESNAVMCTALRMSRCFPEADSLMALYRLYRGVDLDDVARAHQLALTLESVQFEVFNVSASSPFKVEDCTALWKDAASVIRSYYPAAEAIFSARGWRLPRSIDRVYVIDKAARRLSFQPRIHFAELLGEAGKNLPA